MCTALEPQANSGSPRIKAMWFWTAICRAAGPTSNRQFGQMEGWKEGNKQKEGDNLGKWKARRKETSRWKAWWSSKAKMCTALGPQANSGRPRIKITWFLVVNRRTVGPTSNQTMAANSRWKQANSKQADANKQTEQANRKRRMEGWKEGWKDGRMEGWKDGRKD